MPLRPPPLPPRKVSARGPETATMPTSIASRIANLQLESLVHNPFGRHHKQEVETYTETVTTTNDVGDDSEDAAISKKAPPIPSRSTRPAPPQDDTRPPDLVRALNRKPPPPPKPVQLEGEATEEHVDNQGDGCIKCRDFSHVDAHAAQFPRRRVKSLDKLAHDLTSPFHSETEKARAIFTWLHHNVAYDAKSYFSGNVKSASPETTLSSGLAVCEGYAGLFKDLAEKVGLEAMTVSGHGKGYGYVDLGLHHPVPEMESNHAWSCVQMDGEWHLIDCCWGSGVLEGMTYKQLFAPNWFTSTPREFGRRHFPTDPGYQLISEEDGGPVSWEDYILAPEAPYIFQDFYKLDFLIDVLQPATAHIEGNRLVRFHVGKRCEHMSTADSDNYVVFITTGGNERTPMEVDAEGGWSATVRVPHSGEVYMYYVSEVNDKDAKGLGVSGFRSASGRKSMSFGGCCRWTIV